MQDRGMMVSVISTQDMERYRLCVASIEVPIHQKDEMINIVHSIMSYFVDHAYGVQTDQITLQSVSKSRFQAAFDRARIASNPENQHVDAALYIGVNSDSSFRGPDEP